MPMQNVKPGGGGGFQIPQIRKPRNRTRSRLTRRFQTGTVELEHCGLVCAVCQCELPVLYLQGKIILGTLVVMQTHKATVDS